MSEPDRAPDGPPPIPAPARPGRRRRPRSVRAKGFKWRSPIGCLAMVGIGTVVALVIAFAALVTLGIAMQTGHVPDSAAVAGEDLPSNVFEVLRDNGIVAAEEDVLFFYSAGMLSFLDDGNLFTDRRVISYWTDDDGALEIQTAAYAEIAAIEPTWSDDFLSDSEIEVTLHDGSWFVLLVSPEADRDHEFHRQLVATWELNR